MTTPRDYAAIAARLRAAVPREERMRWVIDALWGSLATTGVSWIGFYLKDAGADAMTLGPRRDRPACSPIGLHGACGQSLLSGHALVVADVANLGTGYIACFPEDRSELVVPLFDTEGTAYGVLDADSHHLGCFTTHDARSLAGLLREAGLSSRAPEDLPIDVV